MKKLIIILVVVAIIAAVIIGAVKLNELKLETIGDETAQALLLNPEISEIFQETGSDYFKTFEFRGPKEKINYVHLKFKEIDSQELRGMSEEDQEKICQMVYYAIEDILRDYGYEPEYFVDITLWSSDMETQLSYYVLDMEYSFKDPSFVQGPSIY